ncbi:glycosyltransferase family 4 protein [Candidatus Peregrinibacteria bacterium]|jgi:O-antigen biosynthesis protein|nr:glycosyltransferase family 4 protein [Candidatus Peregrinibacteria bacterium]MBT7337544.1 glycosyltransferase family 4 protein [Candidatus Peregrinibacteria bacterium]
MHIALCSHNAELEGAPLHILRLATLLSAQGHQTEIYSPESGPMLELATTQNVQNTVSPELFLESVDSQYCTEQITQNNPDIVIINTVLGAHIVKHLKSLQPHLPVLWMIHESECDQFMATRSSITLEVFTMADAVVFVSQRTKEVYSRFDRGNMHVIHNSIDIDRIDTYLSECDTSALRKKYTIPNDATVVTLIGSICPRKGQREFIESGIRALEQLQEERNLHFLIAGKLKNEHKQYLKEALSPALKQGVQSCFHVLPEQKNPLGYFACTDIYVCNSFIESFPLVVLEAMACGLPIAASNTYGVAEQLDDKESGLLHLPGNISQLTENLCTLIQDQPLCMRLGRNAQRNVREKFSQEKMMNAYNDLLKSLI